MSSNEENSLGFPIKVKDQFLKLVEKMQYFYIKIIDN